MREYGDFPDIETLLDHTSKCEPHLKIEEVTQMFCFNSHLDLHRISLLNEIYQTQSHK